MSSFLATTMAGVSARGGRTAAGMIAGALGLAIGAAQSVPEIEAGSLRIAAGTELTFQFQAPGSSATSYAIETTPVLGIGHAWQTATQAVIVVVADGLFQVSLPVPGVRLFCRVRVLDSAEPGPPLFINEVMADNSSTAADPSGGFSDWIEIYNPNDDAVDLDRYGLTDDETNPGKWRFPAVLIQPRAHLLILASDLNRTNPALPLHTNFKLKAAGETVLLSDPRLRPVDRFVTPGLAVDQSVGRMPDGGGDLQFYARADATPGAANRIIGGGTTIAPPVFVPDGGFFDVPVSVRVTGSGSNQVIRYTLDGSPATVASPILSGDLLVTTSTVLRVLAIDAQGRRSAPEARTYFVGVNHTLPVISLATAPSNMTFRTGYLYGMGPAVLSAQNQVLQNYPYSGSYAWQNREVEIAMEFFETNRQPALRQRAGMKVFGGWGSRAYPQKSLALFARRSYGAGKFDHALFPGLGVDEFESLVLRNSGNDNQGTQQTPPRPPITAFGPTLSYGSYFVNGTFTLLRDALMQRLLDGTSLDTQAYRPVAVYLNGEPWGIYNLREKVTEDYVLSHHDFASGGIDLIEGYGTVNAGSGTVYSQMRSFFAAQNLANPTNYAFVAENYLDIDNTIDYHLAVIYFQNFDIGNIKCWRPRLPRGRFQWLVYDQDYGFGLWPAAVYGPAMARDYSDYDNMFRFYTSGTGTGTGWPNAGGRTLLLRGLLTNPQFKEQFIRRCGDLLNTQFREERVEQSIQEMAAVIRPEIAAHLSRWNWTELTRRGFGVPHKVEYQPFTPATWESNITVLSAFGRTRPAKLRQDCLLHFQLTGGLGSIRVDVDPPGAGRVVLNTVTLDTFPWQGVMFGDITNTLRVVPNPGFRAVGWTTPAGSTNATALRFRVTRDRTNSYVARLQPAPPDSGVPSELLVTEIQYHPLSTADSGDWLELHNPGAAPVNLAGWILRDDQAEHAFPLPDIIVQPRGTVVLCEDDARFRLRHPVSVPCVGSFKFGLNNAGDTVRLFRPDGTVAFSVTYDDAAPWPVAADGTGATLQLIDVRADPTLPASWRASAQLGGTPGQF